MCIPMIPFEISEGKGMSLLTCVVCICMCVVCFYICVSVCMCGYLCMRMCMCSYTLPFIVMFSRKHHPEVFKISHKFQQSFCPIFRIFHAFNSIITQDFFFHLQQWFSIMQYDVMIAIIAWEISYPLSNLVLFAYLQNYSYSKHIFRQRFQ